MQSKIQTPITGNNRTGGGRLYQADPKPQGSASPKLSSAKLPAAKLASAGPKQVPAESNNKAKNPLLSQKKKAGLGYSFLRLMLVVLLFGLVARLIVSGLYLKSSDSPLLSVPSTPQAHASSPPVAAAVAAASAATAANVAAAVSPVSTAGLVISGSMASGAAILTSAVGPVSAAAGAESIIPLPPGGEDLRRPQRLPSANRPAPSPTGRTPLPSSTANRPTTPPTASPSGSSTGQGQSVPLPPNVSGSASNSSQTNSRAEELSRREFELNRREAQLNTREEALKALESDVNTKLLTSERTKGELNGLISRNQAILDEQKAVREQQKKEDEELKDARIQHLVTAFKGMKPEQAGVLISSMDDTVAVSILSAMPGSNAGKILAMVNPEKAARLVKSISEQRIDPKALLEASPQMNSAAS